MFKKIAVFFFIISFLACGTLYADDILDLHKQEQSLTVPKLVEIAKGHKGARSDRWESSNPDDLMPLANSGWLFIYEVGNTTFTETVVFNDEITHLDDGTVAVMCVTENGGAGMGKYTDITGLSDKDGNGFSVFILGTILNRIFNFQVEANAASGTYFSQTVSTGDMNGPYDLVGFKIVDGETVERPEKINGGYKATENLWMRGVIQTDEGPIDGVFHKGGDSMTARGDRVVWGYFYASPNDVSWGSKDNPDLYVKIWFDAGGRIDVNYFHVSVPEIDVYSDYPYNGSYDKKGTATMDERYVRHEFQKQ